MTTDEIDHQILDLLRQDGRASINAIAQQVQLSPAPVSRRIRRMEDEGIIRGYRAIIDDRAASLLDAFTEVRLASGTETRVLEEVAATIPEVHEVLTIAGATDALVHFRVDDVDHLQRVVNALRGTRLIEATKTHIVLHRWTRPASGPGRGARSQPKRPEI